ncbi:iron-containing alcohol dehydrogenase [Candidatus Margulisiibacteriota bacterium]
MDITSFEFSNIPKIFFSAGVCSKLSQISCTREKNVLIVTGKRSFTQNKNCKDILNEIKDNSRNCFHCSLSGEPSVDFVDGMVRKFKEHQIDVVIAVGGGSVIDAGKAISAMLDAEGSVLTYLEGVGNRRHNGRKKYFMAVPTTAGTGSEATKNAVISNVGPQGFKRSLRHDNFVPDVAVIDPKLTLSCPPSLTAACGMDAFTQLLEAYVSVKASTLTDTLAYNGMQSIVAGFLDAYKNGEADIEARARMSYGALLSGIVLANAGLGVVHGLASIIGGYYNIPHGVVCGTLFAEATSITIQKLVKIFGWHYPVLGKYANIGRLFVTDSNRKVDYYCDLLIDRLNVWTDEIFKLPKLSDYGVNHAGLGNIIKGVYNKNNPINLSENDIEELLLRRI